jgi:hypothetical protein
MSRSTGTPRKRGGHFAAWEQPALHAKEIRDCFAKVR